MDRGLRIQEALPEIPHQFDVRFSMDAPEVGDRRGRRRFDPMKKPFPLQTLDDGAKTVRPLHMEGRWNMVEEPRIVHDHDHGKGGIDFKASSGPNRAAGPRRFDERQRRAKVFTHRLQVGTSCWKPAGSCWGIASGSGLLLRRIFGDA